MTLIQAFIFGGLFCAVAELLSQLFKLNPKWLICLFLVLGGALAPFGIIALAQEWGGGGMLVMITAAGNVLEAAGAALVGGNVGPTITAIILFSLIIFIGAVFGVVHAVTHAGKEDASANRGAQVDAIDA